MPTNGQLISQGFQLGVLDDSGTPAFVVIGNVTNRGDLGGESSDVTFTSLDDTAVRKMKGLRDNGSMSNEVNLIPGNAAQKLMWKLNGLSGGAATKHWAVLGSGGTSLPTITGGLLVFTGVTDRAWWAFDAYVKGFKLGGITPDQVQKATVPLTLDGPITSSMDAA